MYKLSKRKVIIILILFLFPFISILIGDFTPINFGKLYTFGMSIKDFLGIWITVWGAIGVAVNIYLHNQRIDKMDKQVKLQSEANQHAQFSKAVELLGSENMNVRFGAISLLGFVAKDFPEYKNSVCLILNHHLRKMVKIIYTDSLSLVNGNALDYRKNLENRDLTEIQIVVDVLCKKFNGIYLYEGHSHDFSYINFEGSPSQKLSFDGASLRNVIFKGAVLNQISFNGADLSGADFSIQIGSNTSFKDAIMDEDIDLSNFLIPTF